ncbi:MAG: DNA polymerase III subunit delta [Chitinophagales bacterium]|jgi:DNA polymerase-3 subunit delta|nr:DNA polymerase III subunit delta [Chitinophagales bacterium]
MISAFDAVLRDLKNKIYHPIYLLEGEEPYYIDLISDYIENNLLPPSERSFNQTILYGKEISANEIRQQALNYPMFSNYQVIIVKEAQMLKKWDELLPYIEKPVKSTILVLCHRYENIDRRTKVGKTLHSNAVVMTTKKLYENQVPNWIEKYLAERNLNIEPQAASLIVEYVGNELSRVSNELEKLILNLNPGVQVTVEDVEKNIGISKEYNTFELTKAIGLKDGKKVNRIIKYFIANPKVHSLVFTLGSLYNYFSRLYIIQYVKPVTDADMASLAGVRPLPFILNEYKAALKNYSLKKIEEIFDLLQQYDLRSKGIKDSGTPEEALLQELAYKILH